MEKALLQKWGKRFFYVDNALDLLFLRTQYVY